MKYNKTVIEGDVMKKVLIIISIVVLLIIGALAGIGVIYTNSVGHDSGRIPNNTSINGVDCSGLTYEQAEAKVSDSWNSKYIVIVGDLGEQLASYTDFGYEYDLVKEIKRAGRKQIIASAINHYTNAPVNLIVPMKVSGHNEAFKKEVSESAFLNNEDAVESKDAYVDLSDPDFNIVHETYGTKINQDRFFDALTLQIQTGTLQFMFEEEKYYDLPKVTADDPELIKYQEFCKKHLNRKITYELGAETFTIPGEKLAVMVPQDLEGKIDEKAVAAYVAELAAEYDNVGAERNFTSLSGKEVTVSGGTYGWKINQKAETKRLIEDLNSGKEVSRPPVFSQTGQGEYTKTIGNTYIDVDISNQTVKFYKNGDLIYSSNCVTGCRANGTTTELGTYYILNKVRDVVLRGDNGDGTQYESPVRYWLGVNWDGEGFHDANWRATFGGSIWIYNGSHGCINMPMGELYQKASVGTPVVVHY